MAPIVLLSGEVPFVSKKLQEGDEQSAFNWLLIGAAVTGVFGFLVNVAGFLQVSHTSPTTRMVSGVVHGV
jgi:GDP-fucose transporter C1